MSRGLRSHWTHAALLALLASIVHTWPLASDPAGLSLHYNADVMLNEWIVAWIQHQLPRDPSRLFDANIFYPATRSLAFSEPLIVPALLGAPVRLAGGSPVLVHNLLLLAGLTLSVLAGYALGWRWTGDRTAGLVAGFAYTFNTQTLMRIEHLQAVHAYGLPLAVLAADGVLRTGSRRWAVMLGLLMAMMAYTSGYLVVFAAFAILALVVVRPSEALRHQTIKGMLTAFVLGTLLAVPVYSPYREAAAQQHMRRPLESVYQFSASADAYLASYSRLHHALWNAGAPREFADAYFPGITIGVLAAIGLVASWKRDQLTRARLSAMVFMALIGCVLSLGTRTPVYGLLYEHVPLMSSLRAAGRFGILFLLAVAVLAAYGIRSQLQRIANTRARVALGVGVLMLINLEALRAPLELVPYKGIPGPYHLLAQEPGPVVLVEAPFHLPETIFLNADYVFNSTAHWRPLMNGYSGYIPAPYREYVKSFWDFPDPRAVDAMAKAGATHLMLHPERYGREADATISQALANRRLERLAVGRDGSMLFRIR